MFYSKDIGIKKNKSRKKESYIRISLFVCPSFFSVLSLFDRLSLIHKFVHKTLTDRSSCDL